MALGLRGRAVRAGGPGGRSETLVSAVLFLKGFRMCPLRLSPRLVSGLRVFFMLGLAAGAITGGGRAAAPAVIDPEVRPLFVEGYAGQVSYAPGDELTLHVSTSAANFEVEIARVGAKRDIVWTARAVAGREQPVPENASSHGCQWAASVAFKIPVEWRTGYYQVTLRAADRGGKFTQRGRRTAEGGGYFVLRAARPGQGAKILLQLATNTYNAYNNWGGSSLYAFHGRGGNQGHRVSIERPTAGQFDRWEQPFVEWAERQGVALEYAANSDLESRPELLTAYRLVLSVGHDEYWSALMRDHLEQYIGKGGNVAFFSGNTCCWQVRSEADGKALTCWKQNFQQDPVYGARGSQATLTSLWSHYLVARPENTLTGVGFLWGGYHRSHGQFMDGSGAFTVHRPEHWLYAGTGLKKDDVFGGKDTIVGYECDGCELTWKDGLPMPTGRDGTPDTFTVLGTAPARWHPDDSEWYERWENGRSGHAVMGVYTRGGTVFTCGSTDWSHGLRGGDKAVEQITRNILERLGR